MGHLEPIRLRCLEAGRALGNCNGLPGLITIDIRSAPLLQVNLNVLNTHLIEKDNNVGCKSGSSGGGGGGGSLSLSLSLVKKLILVSQVQFTLKSNSRPSFIYFFLILFPPPFSSSSSVQYPMLNILA